METTLIALHETPEVIRQRVMTQVREKLDKLPSTYVVMTDYENADCFLIMGISKNRADSRGKIGSCDHALWHFEPIPGHYLESVFQDIWPDLRAGEDIFRFQIRYRIIEQPK